MNLELNWIKWKLSQTERKVDRRGTRVTSNGMESNRKWIEIEQNCHLNTREVVETTGRAWVGGADEDGDTLTRLSLALRDPVSTLLIRMKIKGNTCWWIFCNVHGSSVSGEGRPRLWGSHRCAPGPCDAPVISTAGLRAGAHLVLQDCPLDSSFPAGCPQAPATPPAVGAMAQHAGMNTTPRPQIWMLLGAFRQEGTWSWGGGYGDIWSTEPSTWDGCNPELISCLGSEAAGQQGQERL